MLAEDSVIMIVDDMKMVRTSVKRYLNTLGYTKFVEAENGNDAVSKFKNNQVDFIFMDVVMPNSTGVDALKKIREEDLIVPVVMLSSVADEQTIDECNKLGITGYVLKPLNAETGPDKLKEMLKKAYALTNLEATKNALDM